MAAHFEALDEGVLLVPLDPRYTQFGSNLTSVQVCMASKTWVNPPAFKWGLLQVPSVWPCLGWENDSSTGYRALEMTYRQGGNKVNISFLLV